MGVVELARAEYYKRMEEQKRVIEKLNSDDIQTLEKSGLITINRDNIPTESDILHDSFYSTAFNRLYYEDNIYVYVCDLRDNGRKEWDRRYTHATLGNGNESLQYSDFCREWDSFKHFNIIIQLPYLYGFF